VLVEVHASGVCHTDHDSLTWGRPVVIGHEGAGVVLAVGEDVTRVAPGDRVLLNWAMPCGECGQCSRGHQNICEVNSPVTRTTDFGGHARLETTRRTNGMLLERSFNLGTMSTHAMVIEAACVKIEVDIPMASACILGCGVMTGWGSVVNAARVKAGSTVVVLGAGGVGLNVIQGARVAGARRIVAVDIMPERLEFARQFGATDTVRAERGDTHLMATAGRVKGMLGGGADFAFECTAVPELGAAPLAFIRNAGTAIQASGIEQAIPFDAELFEWDKTYLNPLYGQCRPQLDFPRLLDLYSKDMLLLDELVTRTYSLDELPQAFEDMLSGRNAKGVVLMGGACD
jgi:S-(hydroxymethyl)glutathione dehydrogenase/alcohol dehydrogenase